MPLVLPLLPSPSRHQYSRTVKPVGVHCPLFTPRLIGVSTLVVSKMTEPNSQPGKQVMPSPKVSPLQMYGGNNTGHVPYDAGCVAVAC